MIKKTVIMLLLVVTALTTSCKKEQEESATLKVVNHTNCSYKVDMGMDGNGGYVGSVAPLETREFKITSYEESFRQYFVASPINCTNGQEQHYDFFLHYGTTKSILIDN